MKLPAVREIAQTARELGQISFPADLCFQIVLRRVVVGHYLAPLVGPDRRPGAYWPPFEAWRFLHILYHAG